MTSADIKDPPRYHYYCESCTRPFQTWEQTEHHRKSGHSITGFEWPPKEKRVMNRRVPLGRQLMVLPCQALEVLA
jgi:hypothetical protein